MVRSFPVHVFRAELESRLRDRNLLPAPLGDVGPILVDRFHDGSARPHAVAAFARLLEAGHPLTRLEGVPWTGDVEDMLVSFGRRHDHIGIRAVYMLGVLDAAAEVLDLAEWEVWEDMWGQFSLAGPGGQAVLQGSLHDCFGLYGSREEIVAACGPAAGPARLPGR